MTIHISSIDKGLQDLTTPEDTPPEGESQRKESRSCLGRLWRRAASPSRVLGWRESYRHSSGPRLADARRGALLSLLFIHPWVLTLDLPSVPRFPTAPTRNPLAPGENSRESGASAV